MAVHRTYLGYPPDTQHWAPGDAEPTDGALVYDNTDLPWQRDADGWRRAQRGLIANRLRSLVETPLPWGMLAQQRGPLSSAPRR